MDKNEKLIELLTKAVKAWYEDYKRCEIKNCYLSYHADDEVIGITRIPYVQGWKTLLDPGDLKNCRIYDDGKARYSYEDGNSDRDWTETLEETIDRLNDYISEYGIDLNDYDLTDFTEKRASEYSEEEWGEDTAYQSEEKLKREILVVATKIVDWEVETATETTRVAPDLVLYNPKTKTFELEYDFNYKKSLGDKRVFVTNNDGWGLDRALNRLADFTEQDKDRSSDFVSEWIYENLPDSVYRHYLYDSEIEED